MSLRRLTRARPARILLATIGLLGALAALIVRAAPPSLLARAKEAADASGWIAMPPNWRNGVSFGTLNTYAWLSSRELLVFVGNKATPVAWQQDGPMLGPSSPGAACIYGLSSGRYTRIERLSALLLRHVGCTDASLRVSPDHSRLWWAPEPLRDNVGYISPLDGSSAQAVDPEWFHCWTADGRHVTQFEWRADVLTGIKLRDTADLRRTRRFAVPRGFGVPLRISNNRAVGIVRPLSATWDLMQTPIVSDVRITELPLRAGADVRATAVHLPIRAALAHVSMSPDGSKIAWLFVRVSRVAVPRWLRWAAPRALTRPSTTTSLWVSDARGKGMREIGEMGAANTTRPAFEPQLIQWLPNSRRISFVYDRSLYVVSAD